jgi:hypothetical protein
MRVGFNGPPGWAVLETVGEILKVARREKTSIDHLNAASSDCEQNKLRTNRNLSQISLINNRGKP